MLFWLIAFIDKISVFVVIDSVPSLFQNTTQCHQHHLTLPGKILHCAAVLQYSTEVLYYSIELLYYSIEVLQYSTKVIICLLQTLTCISIMAHIMPLCRDEKKNTTTTKTV